MVHYSTTVTETRTSKFVSWVKDGSPWIWFNAGAVAISSVMVIGLLTFIGYKALTHFWPKTIYEYEIKSIEDGTVRVIAGEVWDTERFDRKYLMEAGVTIPADIEEAQRTLIKVGNRELTGLDFTWKYDFEVVGVSNPAELARLERREWGNFYGYPIAIKEEGKLVSPRESLWQEVLGRIERANALHKDIRAIEEKKIGAINYKLERLRLREKRLRLDNELTQSAMAELANQRVVLEQSYEVLQTELLSLRNDVRRDVLVVRTAGGHESTISFEYIISAVQPNSMSIWEKVKTYMVSISDFIVAEPREANTEGGVFPAIFGTVLMVIIMSIIVTPFGVIAAIYLREYASQGWFTRTIRIGVNNLAGVPSIVYGVFGLGFFVYFLGGNIDDLFYPEAAPAPVFGTPGLLWASVTLALLTVPVVIVATEEGLSRIPRSVKEGSLALGATKFETLYRVIIPMASPAMMTGLILAVARAAGEVAPLMLVGVVKLAPSLPLDANMPFLHLERKFMHLGFHIYDVGFQSPNVEAARPLVYATAFLLVLVIGALNLAAVNIRNRLREKYKSLET